MEETKLGDNNLGVQHCNQPSSSESNMFNSQQSNQRPYKSSSESSKSLSPVAPLKRMTNLGRSLRHQNAPLVDLVQSNDLSRKRTYEPKRYQKQHSEISDQSLISLESNRIKRRTLKGRHGIKLISSTQIEDIDQIFEYFSNFYATAIPKDLETKHKCIILQANKNKLLWDFYITLCLLFTTLVVPVRLAFSDSDPLEWIVIYAIVDLSFAIDIIFTFFTSFTDSITNLEVVEHKKIAINYFKGWFIFDMGSVIPFDYFIEMGGGGTQSNLNSLLRFAKFSKIYKIVRLTRLAKVFKLLKSNKSLVSKISEKLKISNGVERLLIFVFFFFILAHVAACMFVLIAGLEDEDYQTWVTSYGNYSGVDLYIQSIYFTVTTVATVGYGDIYPVTLYERLYTIFLMIVGVSAFTFISGALSSIISNYDLQQAALQEKLLHLNRLRVQANLKDDMYSEIRNALMHESKSKNHEQQFLLNDLPLSLRMELSMTLHKQVFNKFTLFTEIGDKYFITWVSSQLKPQIVTSGQAIYSEDNEIDGFYFMIRGLASFVLPYNQNMIFAVIDPEGTIKPSKKREMQTFQYFGLEDSVLNHTKLCYLTQTKSTDALIKNGEKLLNRRQYSVQCIKQAECLTLSMVSLDRMRKDFRSTSTKFFKEMMDQFMLMHQYHQYCVDQFVLFKSPDKGTNDRQFKADVVLKQQAYKIEECISQINSMVKQLKDINRLELDWTSSISEAGSSFGSQRQGEIEIKEAGSSQEQSSDTSSVESPPKNIEIQSPKQLQTEKKTYSSQQAFHQMLNMSPVSKPNIYLSSKKTQQMSQLVERRTTVLYNNALQKEFQYSKNTILEAVLAASKYKGHKALAVVLEIALKAKRSGNNLLQLMKQNLRKKIEEGKHKFNVINCLVENKDDILTNLVAEQSFRIAVNSVDPKMHAIKQIFNSMNDQVQSQIDQLSGDITESQSQIQMIEERQQAILNKLKRL